MLSISGIGSGLDTGSIVDAIVQSEIEPRRQLLSTREKNYDSQISALGKLKSALESFQSALNDLSKANKFESRSVTVGNEDLLSVSATGSAVPGNYQVEVVRMAEPQKLISAAGSFADSSATVGSGTLTIGSGDNSFDVTIAAGTDSLADVADAINKAEGNDSVSATIVNVDNGSGGTEARLMLTSREPGKENEITITAVDDDGNNTDGAGLSQLAYDSATASGNMGQHQAAVDSLIRVDGLDVTRSGNSITDVIAGVTLDLKDAEPGTSFAVEVAVDSDQISDNVNKFVEEYNKLNDLIKDLGRSSEESAGALAGDFTLRTVYNQVRAAISNPVSTSENGIDTLALVGIEVDQYGKMSLDRTKLKEQLDSNFSSVSSLFASDDGVANRLDDLMDQFTQFNGLLDSRTDGLKERKESVEQAREALARREEQMIQSLSRQFNAMDNLVGQLKGTGSYLSQQLAALNSN